MSKQIFNSNNKKVYILQKNIGEGGFSEVYIGFNKNNSNTKLAIKRIRLEQYEKDLVQNEIEILKSLMNKCDNVVDVYDHFKYENYYYIIMELIKGSDLWGLHEYMEDQYMMEQERNDYKVILFKKVMDALLCVHDNGIVHRDLKPDNIMFVPNTNDYPIVKLIDFGLACNIKKCIEFAGTYTYVSPEIAYETVPTTYLSDIYSMGVAFLILFDPYFQGIRKNMKFQKFGSYWNKYMENFPKLPKELKIVKDMIHIDPLNRPTAKEVVNFIKTGEQLSLERRRQENIMLFENLKKVEQTEKIIKIPKISKEENESNLIQKLKEFVKYEIQANKDLEIEDITKKELIVDSYYAMKASELYNKELSLTNENDFLTKAFKEISISNLSNTNSESSTDLV